MVSYREVERKRDQRLEKKLDRREPIRATIVDEFGLDSGPGNIWADANTRRVWIRELGTAGASSVPCYNIEPEIGLGVMVGYEAYSDIREVLSSDKKFLGQTNPDGRTYEAATYNDYQPGGRFQQWIAPKMITPLATVPDTGLSVKVVSGDYPYAGVRVSFAGQLGIALTQNPNVGEHYYAGLYLDSANTLQIVYGASIAVASAPPEPAWPAGAFRLSVVRVNDTQTSIRLLPDTNVLNDIFDRRMPWSDEGSVSAATQAEVDAGTVTNEYVSPLTFQTGLTTRLGYVLRPNPIINGGLLVWQRGTSFAAAVTSTYTADRFVYYKVGAMVHTINQSSDVPTVAEAGLLAQYSLLLDCTTVDASIAAGDYAVEAHIIEGFNFLPLTQRAFTLSFWVKGTKTGIHCVSFKNSGQDRSYVAEYTINTTATWEYKTITVSASPSAGTWNYTTGVGLNISFTLACGSTFQTTAGAWQTGNFFATANQVNACDDTANDFRLSLIKIEPGSVATPFIMPDYGIELGRCLRYTWLIPPESGNNQGQGVKATTTLIGLQLRHPVPMRIAPTLAHNITGYTAGVPGTTTVGLINYVTNAFYIITGALTVTMGASGTDYSNLFFTAGTSWDGTVGNLTTLRVGPGVVACLSAEY